MYWESEVLNNPHHSCPSPSLEGTCVLDDPEVFPCEPNMRQLG